MPAACESVRAALATWRAGGPPPDRREADAAHLGDCPACRAAVEDVVGESDERVVAHALEGAAARPGFADGVVRRLAADAPRSQAPGIGSGAVEDDPFDPDDRFGVPLPRGRTSMGMVIEYCRTCRERIDPQDFKNGQALAWKGQCYCVHCKDPVLAKLANDPEFQAQQRAAAKEAHRSGSGRVEAVADRGTGRRHHSGSYQPQGPNKTLVLVGAGGGVLALVVVALLVIGTGDPPSGSGQKPPTSAKPTTVRSGPKGPVTSAPVAPPTPEESPADKLRRRQVEDKVRGKFDAIRQFARDNPDEFAEIDLKWKNFIEDDLWKDPIVVKSDELSKLRDEARAEQKRGRELVETSAKSEADRIIPRAEAMAQQGNFGGAYRELDRFPMKYRETEHWKRIEACRDEIRKKEQATTVDFRFGEWVTVSDGKGADRWSLSGGTVKNDEADGCVVATAGAQTGLLVFQAPRQETWADYDVEAVMKGDAGCQFGFRVSRNPNTDRLEGNAVAFDDGDAAAFKTYKLSIADQKWTLEQDGQAPMAQDTVFKRGKIMFIVQPGKSIRIKLFKVRVTKGLG